MCTGDINRPEVLKNFDVGDAKACVFTIDDMTATNKVLCMLPAVAYNHPLIILSTCIYGGWAILDLISSPPPPFLRSSCVRL